MSFRYNVSSWDYEWVRDLLRDSAGAIGVYLALIFMRQYGVFNTINDAVRGFLSYFNNIYYKKFFAGKVHEAEIAISTGCEFIREVLSGTMNVNDIVRLLYCVENEFLDDFASAFKMYIRKDVIPEKLRDKVSDVLKGLRIKLLGSAQNFIPPESLRSWIKEILNESDTTANDILRVLIESNLIFTEVNLYGLPIVIIPRPLLTDEVIEFIRKPLSVKHKAVEVPESVFKYYFSKLLSRLDKYVGTALTKEVLEGIVAEVFKVLNFKVSTNQFVPTKFARSIEVDVIAKRDVIGISMPFTIWVECKNWNRDVDRDVIDVLFSKIINSIESPNLTILICKSASKAALSAAKAVGVLVIELGAKANLKNATELGRILLRKVLGIFGIPLSYQNRL